VAALSAALLALSACDRGPASIPARDHAGGAAPLSSAAAAVGSGGDQDRVDPNLQVATTRDDPRSAPVPLVDGKPMWAANRRHTAEENARYQFARDGADFGARDVDDFVAKVHAFVERPPRGVETLTRPNGDRLLYDPDANVFAVVSAEGAPRTMFKPRDGAAYWQDQKQRLADQSNGADSQRKSNGRRQRAGSSADDQG
jgi:pyocin large subunit-like protein